MYECIALLLAQTIGDGRRRPYMILYMTIEAQPQRRGALPSDQQIQNREKGTLDPSIVPLDSSSFAARLRCYEEKEFPRHASLSKRIRLLGEGRR